jgi:hypothetical protein
MDARLELDYCPACDLPTFNHEEIVVVHDEYVHRFCFEGSVMVTKKRDLRNWL